MLADRKWVERNLGFDPITTPPPRETFTIKRVADAAVKKTANIDVWRQIITEVQPTLVITTGTAGGIGKEFEVGDVVVSPIVRFDCLSKFKKQPFAQEHFSSRSAVTTSSASTPRTTTSISRGSATSPTRRSRPKAP
ncbi:MULTISPECIES: hypothetical protein [unclassified Bradyrhizobium]|uniref:hypothetical protein n=1 Tax=unclassified Bradyrhizobium TaxID=2631580 RepID=UPI001FF9E019|nr:MULTISPECIES: hypothetical protein [unclassified Bradyrhizobium]